MPLSRIEDALEDIRAGKIVIVVDDEDRENEGDLTMAAEKVTPEAVNFMARHGRGLICLPMTPERLEELQIPLMVAENTSNFGTAFTVSIEARRRVTTGISAADRATTILTAIDPHTRPADLARPGHVFPLRSRPGGVLARAGQTEASVDLARIAGLYPAGVICEIMNEDGTMARMPQLEEFSTQFGLRVITIAELIQYRLRTETLIQEVERAELATEFGRFTAVVFRNRLDQKTHLALVKGDVAGGEPVYVRVHTQSIPGDVFLSERNPTGSYLRACLRLIAEQGRGVVVYLRLDDDGERLVGEIRAGREKSTAPGYSYSDDLYRAEDPKHYGVGAQILNQLGLKRIVLLTGHHRKFSALHGYGLDIVGEVDVHTLVPQA
jgi:3,4-dihydroxy 2-butanone 4-phosphate synthase/GTP cyclohydrolase II